jgi:pantothenate kinase
VRANADKADLANAVMKMLTYNIGSLIVLNATIQKTDRVVITGGFTAFQLLKQRLANAVDFWSGGKINASFIKHASYAGAVGAFLHTLNLHERHMPSPQPSPNAKRASSTNSSSSSSVPDATSFDSQEGDEAFTST